jgi:hypothetical protein
MKMTLATILIAAASAASAHPSLITHDHPHGVSAFGGLDTVLVVALAMALALAAWKWARG